MNRWQVTRAGGPGWYQPGWFATPIGTHAEFSTPAWFSSWTAAMRHANGEL